MTDDEIDIRATVQAYLDALGNTDEFEVMFQPARLPDREENGSVITFTRDDWLKALRMRAVAKARGLHPSRMCLIDQGATTMAFVKLAGACPPNNCTDYLSLLKIDGRWHIAQKLFVTTVRKPGAAVSDPAGVF